jgi:hypothetical protein
VNWSEGDARYCSRGHPVSADAQFCSKCGEALTPSTPTAGPSDDAGQIPIKSDDLVPETATAATEVSQTQHPRRSLARLGVIAVVILALAAVGFVALKSFGLMRPQLRGIAVLYDQGGDITGTWDDCQGTGGYSDWGAGMNLSIRGRNDEIVGSGSVLPVTDDLLPTLVEMDRQTSPFIGLNAADPDAAKTELRNLLESTEANSCWLYFSAELEDSDFYSIEIGKRGGLDYSRADLEERHYIVSLNLGDLQ